MSTDLTSKLRNNETRNSKASVGTLAYNLPKGATVTSGESYIIGVIPAGALVTSINVVSITAFDSVTSATCDFGIGATATAIGNDVNIKAAAGTVAAGTGTGYYAASTNITATPTLTGTTTVGNVQVVVEYILLSERTGSYAV